MKKVFLFLIIFILIISAGTAQVPLSLLEPAEETRQFDDYQGSIYNSLIFKEASVIEERSGTFEADIRYNIFTDNLEYKLGETLYSIKKDPEIHIRLNDEYFYFCPFKTQRHVPADGYFVLIDLNETYAIYKKYTLKITEPNKYGGPDATPTPGNIKTVSTYYLEENGYIMELPQHKRELLAKFEDKKVELEAYMKKERIKIKNEEDLIQLVSKYNMLKSDNIGRSRSLLSSNREIRN